MKTLILGLGNPILKDDAVGLLVARRLYQMAQGKEVDLAEAAVGGLELLPIIQGYDRVIIIDAIFDPALEVGEVYSYDVGEPSLNLCASHGISLGQALEMARLWSLSIPHEIKVYAIPVEDPFTFGEELTPRVAAATDSIVRRIAEENPITRRLP